MARLLNGTTDYVFNSSVPINFTGTNTVFTMACWFRMTSFGAPNQQNDLMACNYQTSGNGPNLRMIAVVDTAHSGNNVIWIQARTGLGGDFTTTSTVALSNNIWYHAAGVYTITNGGTGAITLDNYVNGGNKISASTTNISTLGNQTGVAIGCLFISNGGVAFSSARIADSAIWNVALSASEILALANGARPFMIRPLSLIGYWPLDGLQSPEPDLSRNARNGTLAGTPSLAFGPPVTMFTPRWPMTTPVSIPPTFILMPQICM